MINTYLLVVIIIIAILFVSKNINKVNVQEKVIKEKDNIVANLNSILQPIFVKKQFKYNINRWSLSGRNDLYFGFK